MSTTTRPGAVVDDEPQRDEPAAVELEQVAGRVGEHCRDRAEHAARRRRRRPRRR